MKRIFVTAIAMVSLSLGFVSCGGDDELVGNWVKGSAFEGEARSDAASFVINDEAYVGCGYTGKKRMKDLWKFNLDGSWTQCADMPGVVRSHATGFAAAGKGYMGLGFNEDIEENFGYLKDFYEYNPQTNSWTQIADFAGTGRHSALGFGIGNKGFVGMGYDDKYLKDMYCYTPSTGAWEKVTSIPGSKRMGASVFVIEDIAYVCCGMDNGSYVDEFYAYDAAKDQWIEKRKIANVSDRDYDNDYNIPRAYAATFVINGKGYVTCGESGSLRTDTWEYNPATDLWEERTGFEGSARAGAIGITLGNRGFVTTGRSASLKFDDTFEFHPTEDYDEYD